MVKHSHILFGLLLSTPAVHARAPYYPRPPEEKPVESPTAIFNSFRYGYKVAAEIELSLRSFAMVADDLKTPGMDEMLKSTRSDYTLNYLNPKSFAVLVEENPELARKLTAGLSTANNIKERITSEVEKEQAERMKKFRDSFNGAAAPPQVVPLIGMKPLIQRRHAPLVGSTTKLELEPLGLVTADKVPIKDAAIAIPIESDWPRVNARWNALDIGVRKANVHFVHLDPHEKATAYSYALPSRLGTGRYMDVDFTAQAAPYLRGFYLSLDAAAKRMIDGTADKKEEELGPVFEFKHKNPETSATRYLEQLKAFTDKAMITEALRMPILLTRANSSYHLNFSVEGRPEPIDPVLSAWNHLIVVSLLNAGVTNVFGRGFGKYRDDLTARGMIRKHNGTYFEVREHFTDPQSELAMLMRAFNGTNAEARRLIYGELLPKLDIHVLRYMYRQHRPLFYELVLGTPELNIELTPELKEIIRGHEDAEPFFRRAFTNPHLLDDKERVRELLGEDAYDYLKKRMAKYMLAATLTKPDLFPRFSAIVAEDVDCIGKYAALCSKPGRAMAVSGVAYKSIVAVKNMSATTTKWGNSVSDACQTMLTGARSALGRLVPQ